MITKLTRTDNGVALLLDKPLLDELGLDENSEVELSTNGQVLVVTPKRNAARGRKFRETAAKINEKYAGVFRRRSDS